MASWWQKALLTASSLTGLGAGTYALLTRRPVPQKSGTLYLKGLHEAVEVLTDSYGIPHIYAHNEDDLYFAQGYMHAQERLWQMDFNRRLGSGRLAEIVGPAAIEIDRFNRRLGLHRSAAAEVPRLTEHTRRILNAYAQGVNAFIQHAQDRLPVEFTLLRCRPALWQIADTIQWGKMMGWNLCGNWESEITRARLIARLGVERAVRLEAGYDPTHPLIIPPGVEYQGVNPGLLEQYEQIKELSGFGTLGGSNNWVIDGTMSESGLPILCNDPHQGQAIPSLWFEFHLTAGDIDVVGASFPGAPGVVIGHNASIAWGVTNAVSDVQDLYIEKFNPQNPHLYEYLGKWEEAQVIREEIRVKGQEQPVIEEVRITRHGPILTGMPSFSKGGKTQAGDEHAAEELPLALRWTGLESSSIASAILKLNRASNWDEFRDALRDWDTPPQNFVYGDINGNIGYLMAGAIPIRSNQGQALLPSPGWSGEYEWSGLIPFEELPQTYNPEQHFIITANNRVVDDNYPYYISNEWLNGYRARRIYELLTSKEKLTVEDMTKIQADFYALPAREIVPVMLQITATSPIERAAHDILKTWNFELTPESIGASLYTTFLRKLERIVLDPLLGDDETLLYSYLGVGSTVLNMLNGFESRNKPLLLRLLKERDDAWFENSVIANGPRSWDEALASAFRAVIGELREKFGDNILRWQYGALHKMSYNHPLGTIKPLDAFFNRGPFPAGGDRDTVNMAATTPSQPEVVVIVPAYRQIVDFANLSASLSIHAPGQSGHPASKHYDDFITLWREAKYHPMLYERAQIEENTEGTLHLLPR